MSLKHRDIDLNNYKPKTNGKNKALFVELKRLEIDIFNLLDDYDVPKENIKTIKKDFARMRDVINHSIVTKIDSTRPFKKYRLCLTLNGMRKKDMGRWENEGITIQHFYNKVKESDTVDFPRMFVSKQRNCSPAKYELLLLKWYEPGDVRRHRRDKNGKIYEEPFFEKTWVILDSAEVKLEETFWVYGYHHIRERFTVREIISKIMMKGLDKEQTKEFYRHNHRVYLEYGNKMDIITCKNEEESLVLYNMLRDMIVEQKINRIHCIGTLVSPIVIENKEKRIQRYTGWNDRKIKAKNNN